MNVCNVCKNNEVASYARIDNLIYWRCQVCQAILLDPNHYISPTKEKKHYLKHNNKIDENGYNNFLLKLINPIRNKICDEDIGLDYGCGYAPALAYILKQDGINMSCMTLSFFQIKQFFCESSILLPVQKSLSIFLTLIENLKKLMVF